jgi:hypothetical protein
LTKNTGLLREKGAAEQGSETTSTDQQFASRHHQAETVAEAPASEADRVAGARGTYNVDF